jgi:hypothetical protein
VVAIEEWVEAVFTPKKWVEEKRTQLAAALREQGVENNSDLLLLDDEMICEVAKAAQLKPLNVKVLRQEIEREREGGAASPVSPSPFVAIAPSPRTSGNQFPDCPFTTKNGDQYLSKLGNGSFGTVFEVRLGSGSMGRVARKLMTDLQSKADVQAALDEAMQGKGL